MNDKSFLQSKTVWVQVVTILSAFIPAVRDWLANNPVEFLTALGALNVLVRFVTSGKVKLFSNESGAGVPLFIVGILGTALACGGLVSCSVLEGVDVDGKIYYRHESGAKGGIDLVPGKRPGWWFRLPYVKPDGTGVEAEVEVVPQK